VAGQKQADKNVSVFKRIKAFMADSSFTAAKKVNRGTAGNILTLAILLLVAAFMAMPFLYTVMQALKPMNELFIFPPRFFVKNPTLDNFYMLTQQLNNLWVPFTRYLFNSVFVTAVTTVLQIFACSMGAYVLSKGSIKYKNAIFSVIVLTLLFAGDTTAIPRYVIMSYAKIIDTYLAIILPAIAAPLGLFLMKQYIQDGIPDSIIESAKIDGAGSFKIYRSIVMPMCRPVWMTMIIFCFQSVWSQEGLEFIYSEPIKMLPTLFRQISAGGIARAGVSAAAAFIIIVPPITVFIIAQSKVMETMAHSGVKG